MRETWLIPPLFALLLGVVACEEETEQGPEQSPTEAVENAVTHTVPTLPKWLEVSSIRVRSFPKNIGVTMVVLPRDPPLFRGHSEFTIGLHPNRAEAMKGYRQIRRTERSTPRPGTHFFKATTVGSSFCYRNRVEGSLCYAPIGRSVVRVELGASRDLNTVTRLTQVLTTFALEIEKQLDAAA